MEAKLDALQADLDHGLWMAYLLIVLVAIQILVKVLVFWPLVREFRAQRHFSIMMSKHAEVTDAQKARTDEALNKASVVLDNAIGVLAKLGIKAEQLTEATAAGVQHVVETVPTMTAEKVVERLHGDSSHDLRRVQEEQKR